MSQQGLRIVLELDGWRSSPDDYVLAYIRPFLNALATANLAWLRRNPRAPSIYDGGVRYTREPRDPRTGLRLEEWRDLPAILKHGKADCEDLACARVAELRFRGIPARPVLRVTRSPGRNLFHVIVGIGAAREDPSRRLGM